MIAISRRFRLPESEELYAEIEPILREYGTVLRCDFASDKVDDVDFWINRMNVILDVSDVHLFIHGERSSNTLYEFQSSTQQCVLGGGIALLWNFGLRPAVYEKPRQLIVHRTRDGKARVARGPFARMTANDPVAETYLPEALSEISESFEEPSPSALELEREDSPAAQLVEAIDEFLSELHSSFQTRLAKQDDGVLLNPPEYLHVKRTIATLLEQGLSPNEIRSTLFSSCEQVAHHERDIIAYNKALRELTALFAKADSPKPSVRDGFAYLKRFGELCLISLALYANSDFESATKAVQANRSARLIITEIALGNAVIHHQIAGVSEEVTRARELRRFREEPTAIWIRRILSQALTKRTILSISKAVATAVAVIIVAGFIGPHRIIRAYFWAGVALHVYDSAMRRWLIFRVPHNKPQRDQFMAVAHNPLRRWPMRAYAYVVIASAAWWFAYLAIPGWLAPFVRGGVLSVRVAIAVLISFGLLAIGVTVLYQSRHISDID